MGILRLDTRFRIRLGLLVNEPKFVLQHAQADALTHAEKTSSE